MNAETWAAIEALAAAELPPWPEGALVVGRPTPAAVDVGCPHFDTVTVHPNNGSASLSGCKVVYPDDTVAVFPEELLGCSVPLSRVHPVEALPTLVCRWLIARRSG